jgi:predicted nucleotidyltransferase
MNVQETYGALVKAFADRFGDRLQMIVLFGSRSRGEARAGSDHDIFVVVDGLPQDPLQRQREVMAPLLPKLTELPERLSVIAKTSEELHADVTPLLVDICTDGVALYGESQFKMLREQVLQALRASGMERRQIGDTWMWLFPTRPERDWELTWEGYRESF